MRKPANSRTVLWGGMFAVLAVVLFWSRLVGLDLSFWHDEVVTVTRYAGQGPRAVFFGRYLPNNHVLFEILAWATASVFGSSEVTYRLWGLLPALGATAWLTWWAYRRFGHLVAITVAFLAVVSPLLFQISREARGYGLALLAMAGLIIQADSALRDPTGGAVWRFAFFGLLGVLTIPVFAIPYLLATLPLLVDSRIRSRLVLAVGASGILAVVWFAPMLLEILEQSSQEFGRPVPWHGFLTLSMLHLLFPIFRLLLPGVSIFMVGENPEDTLVVLLVWHAIAWALLGIGGLRLWREKSRVLLCCLALPAVGTYLVLAGLGMWALDRFVSYLSLPLFVLFGLGIRGLFDLIPRKGHRAAVLALACLGIWLILSFLPVASHIISVPHEAFKDAALLANESGTELVVTNSARPEGFRYYLASSPQIMNASELGSLFCGEKSAYVFLEHFFKSEIVDTSCLTAKGAVHTRVDQLGRGGHIDVWLVGLPQIESDH